MKKTVLVIGIIIFIALLVIISNFMNNNDNKKLNGQNQETIQTVSKVIRVTEKNFKEEVLNSDKIVLIDFYADWCQPCRKLSPIIEEVAKEKDNVKFIKINVDENRELSNEYGIRSIPTLIIIKDGNVVNRSEGLIPKSEIEKLIDVK